MLPAEMESGMPGGCGRKSGSKDMVEAEEIAAVLSEGEVQGAGEKVRKVTGLVLKVVRRRMWTSSCKESCMWGREKPSVLPPTARELKRLLQWPGKMVRGKPTNQTRGMFRVGNRLDLATGWGRGKE